MQNQKELYNPPHLNITTCAMHSDTDSVLKTLCIPDMIIVIPSRHPSAQVCTPFINLLASLVPAYHLHHIAAEIQSFSTWFPLTVELNFFLFFSSCPGPWNRTRIMHQDNCSRYKNYHLIVQSWCYRNSSGDTAAPGEQGGVKKK